MKLKIIFSATSYSNIHTEYDYGENNRVISKREIYYQNDGTYINYYDYTYSSSGIVTKLTERSTVDGEELSAKTHYFSDDGRYKQLLITEKGILSKEMQLISTEGNTCTYQCTDDLQNNLGELTITYDEKGNIIYENGYWLTAGINREQSTVYEYRRR